MYVWGLEVLISEVVPIVGVVFTNYVTESLDRDHSSVT